VSAKEEFYQLLDNMWHGGRTTSFNDGSGIQKLLGFRAKWYAEKIRPQLKGMIDESLHELAGYEDEFYARAYRFLKKYINPKTGTIHFYDTSASEGVTLSPFSAGDDTSLNWKTQDLYYIKQQQIPLPMNVSVGETGKHIHFEIGNIDDYIKGEKKELSYAYGEITENGISIIVKSGKGQNTESIAKKSKKEGMEIPVGAIELAINDFKSQTNTDFFVNKDAGKFLHKRLNEESGTKLVNQIDHTDDNLIRRERFYRKVMGTIIDLCAQFEDEILRIWLKPKFVCNSHYMITLDKMAGNTELLEKIVSHGNMTKFQVPLWKTLGIVEEAFHFQDILEDGALKDEFQYLPIDTSCFPDILHEILDSAFDSIDEELDGWLIHADNFAALNNIKSKFSKSIQTGYIDPPFNTGSDDNFEYMDKFQDSTWLTMMENRLTLIRDMMHKDGAFFLHLDHNANHLGKKLLCEIFGKDLHRNDIIWKYPGMVKSSKNKLKANHDQIYYWAMSENTPHFPPMSKYANPQIDLAREGLDGKTVNKKDSDGNLIYQEPKTETKTDNVWGVHGKDKSRKVLKSYLKDEHKDKFANATPVISFVDDLTSVQWASPEYLGFTTQKPELLPARIFEMTSESGDIVMDINLGSGTSIAAAHKIGRRWIGVEMGHHFNYEYRDEDGNHRIGILGRMAQVLAAKGKKMDPKSGAPTNRDSEPNTKLSKKVDWSGGGAFKYYSLENHEDVLLRAKYASGIDIDVSAGIPPYLFHSDPKLVEEGVNPETGMLALERLFGDTDNRIDLAETISHVLGLKIKSIASDSVTLLRNGEDYVINFEEIPVEIWKPLFWWGEPS